MIFESLVVGFVLLIVMISVCIKFIWFSFWLNEILHVIRTVSIFFLVVIILIKTFKV